MINVSKSLVFLAYAKVKPLMVVSTAAVAVEGVGGSGAEFCRLTNVKWKSRSSSRSSLGRKTRLMESGS